MQVNVYLVVNLLQVHTLNGKSGTGRTDNIRQALKPEKFVSGATFDRSTKTMFGFSTNWDIFA